MMSGFRLLLGFLLGSVLGAQIPTVSPQQTFVDWHRDLERKGALVVVGKLGKLKEGKRERLPDGKLGGGSAVSAVSGTQYFKVPASCALQPRAILAGDADPKERLKLEFELQLARLPDGVEQRQTCTGNGAPIAADVLALFVLAPNRDKKAKGLELLHMIAFDPKADPGSDAEMHFADTMRDFQDVNQRMIDLERAIATVDSAKGPESLAEAQKQLRELLAKSPELRVPANDALLTQHVAPLEQRAQKKLAEGKVEGEGGDKRGDGRI